MKEYHRVMVIFRQGVSVRMIHHLIQHFGGKYIHSENDILNKNTSWSPKYREEKSQTRHTWF